MIGIFHSNSGFYSCIKSSFHFGGVCLGHVLNFEMCVEKYFLSP